MSKERILLCLAHMSGNEQKYIDEAFAGSWVIPLGPNVDGFEKELLKFLHTGPTGEPAPWAEGSQQHVVALSSGTAAIHLALLALGIGQGDEVVCQSFTFCASCNPVMYVGATPVLVDSEPQTWNMDPALLDRALTERERITGHTPKAIIVVHLYGMPADMDAIREVARRHGDVPIIEDAAEALGSRYKGREVSTFGRFGVLSFNGNKMITTSGGGALVCSDLESARRVKYFATQAREAYAYYHHTDIGYNYRMSNICAGIGRGQLTILDEHVAHHQMIAGIYREAFADFAGITLHDNPSSDYDSNFWLSTILLAPEIKIQGREAAYTRPVRRAVGGSAGFIMEASELHTAYEPDADVEALRMILDTEGIESRPLWKPMHLQPVYAQAPAYVNGTAECIFRRGICLPSGPAVTAEQARMIAGLVKGAVL